MKKYTIDVIMNTSNGTFNNFEQIKTYSIIADDMSLVYDNVYKFYKSNKIISYFPIKNSIITNIEELD